MAIPGSVQEKAKNDKAAEPKAEAAPEGKKGKAKKKEAEATSGKKPAPEAVIKPQDKQQPATTAA